MKYRTKLYVALLGTAIVCVVLGLGIAYYQVRTFLLEELRSKVMSIAAATAASLDEKRLKTIQSPHDQTSENYKIIQKELRAIRDANRRKDVYAKFIYTLIPQKEDPEQFVFQVDAEEDTADFSPFGSIVPDAKDDFLNLHLGEVYSPNHFIVNQWGTWMTGFAPIFDSNGKYVASVGVDLRASDVIAKLNRLLEFGIFAFLGALLIALIVAFFLSRQVTRSLNSLYEGVKKIGSGNLNTKIQIVSHDEFGALAKAVNSMTQGLQERERLKSNFTRYVSQHVMESILASEAPVKLEGERRKVTVVFTDIRQFTHVSEDLPPEKVVSLLNEYFAVMVDIIFKNQGSLDKFIGDGMMVEFGAPLDDPLQELHAVTTAIEMQQAIKKLSTKWQSEGWPAIKLGIGVHSGIAIVGNIGSERRIEYTAIGDTVNVASRLEQLTKELKTPILISEATVKAIENNFKFKNLGPFVLHGRVHPIVVYALDEEQEGETEVVTQE